MNSSVKNQVSWKEIKKNQNMKNSINLCSRTDLYDNRFSELKGKLDVVNHAHWCLKYNNPWKTDYHMPEKYNLKKEIKKIKR